MRTNQSRTSLKRRAKSKTGRNDRCPCGSGKKYKRCCLNRPQTAPAIPRADPRLSVPPGGIYVPPLADSTGWPLHRLLYSRSAAEALARGEQLPGPETHPWVVARLREQLGVDDSKNTDRYSLRELRTTPTRYLLAWLEGLDVVVRVESFADDVGDLISAWALSERWAVDADPMADKEFLGLAACELWRRLLPERPSLEMLDDLMQAGYDAIDAGDREVACELWLKLWDDLLLILPESVRTFEEADKLFQGLQSLGNWVGDLEIELYNTSIRNPAFLPRGLKLYERLVERFAPTREHEIFRKQLAEYSLRCGHEKRGVTVLRELISEKPDDAAAYVTLSEYFSKQGRTGEALALLEEAVARPVANIDDWDLRQRLDELRRSPRG